ncbi:hypothetical protein EDB81DRAFT_818676 [Dactylonectria macrodidyma]|uniref:Uncharacterized protein n=1 Tax=Dactylonectria macrodidyma TaxID=307937 RepID=A0A9P9DEK0_9HYPO|nr:hypothetical protein EDB81DRAFT_818676 [Dactylonectria macrodidyma]
MPLAREATARFGFIDAREQDPAVLDRRRLEAKRALNYRRRRKAKQNINTADYQTESRCQVVELGAEAGQTEPSTGSAPDDIEEFGQYDIPADDISITSSRGMATSMRISTEPDTYSDEEPVHLHDAEEHGA